MWSFSGRIRTNWSSDEHSPRTVAGGAILWTSKMLGDLFDAIPVEAKAVDVGVGSPHFPRTDYVIDAISYEKLGIGSRYSED